ncbi:MAG: phospho-N-acetylmuramoyl-pentapeptide-transferase [Tissierellia bacterium]|nr:phospho-N-acetylmuramoyl-pentapeptide-transferase [Tissierellia bacterium]
MLSNDKINLILAFVISFILSPIIVTRLKKLNIGQSIREEGPESHLVKSGTPTMGGIIFMISTVLTLLIMRNHDSFTIICTMSMILFGVLGYADDYIKIVMDRNLGLRAYQKLIGQILLAIILVFVYIKNGGDTYLYIPFTSMKLVNFGILYYPLIIFVIVGTVNSVNLTDGLDGLATGVSAIVLIAFSAILYGMGNVNNSVFGATLTGALLGFLRVNRYPAKVFMGDTGSLALGGAVAAIAIMSKLSLFLPILGGVYFAETLSVIIQVSSFKLTGKRVFKMAPLHHHFEAKGLSEPKVITRFYIASVILAIIAILGII